MLHAMQGGAGSCHASRSRAPTESSLEQATPWMTTPSGIASVASINCDSCAMLMLTHMHTHTHTPMHTPMHTPIRMVITTTQAPSLPASLGVLPQWSCLLRLAVAPLQMVAPHC